MKILFTKAILIITLSISSNLLQSSEPQTQKGATSIYFGFSGLSELNFDDSFIGVTYLFANKLGAWADVSLGFLTTKTVTNSVELKDNMYGFSAGIIWYAMQKGSIAFYITPSIGYDNHNYDKYDNNSIHKIAESSLSIGCSFAVEWWAFDDISFYTGVRLAYINTTGNIETPTGKNDYSSSFFGFVRRNPNIGVCFYF